MATKKDTSIKGVDAAAPKPKSASKKSTSASKVSQSKKMATIPKPKRFGDTILDEIILILFILASVIIIISLFNDNMGLAGKIINSLLKGTFGFGSYLLPILIIAFCLWMLISDEKNFKILKLVASILFLIGISALFHTFNVKSTDSVNAIALYNAGDGTNGGMVGGLIGNVLIKAFDKIGTYLILSVTLLISIILGTGKSFFSGLVNSYSFMNVQRKKRNEKIKYKAERIRVSEEEYERKQEKKNEKSKAKKSEFNIKISEEEGSNVDPNAPVIEALLFKSTDIPKPVKSSGIIYDFTKEAESRVAHVPEEPVEIKDDDNIEKFIKEVVKEEFVPVINSNDTYDEDIEDSDIMITAYKENIAQPLSEEDEDLKRAAVKAALIGDAVFSNDLQKVEVETEKTIDKKIDSKSLQKSDEIRPEQSDEEYKFPPLELLGKNMVKTSSDSKVQMLNNAKKLEETLKSFGVDAKVIQINKGPTVTRYELSPSQGVKVSKIVNLADDIALNLAASGIRIEAPIPGKAAVGIEVPNKETQSVYLRTVLESENFQKFPSKLAFALGEDIAGNAVVTDIAKMPHLLIAGATGSGKSVCINTLITSILYKANPNEVKLLLVDPKVVELSVYNGIPHLLIPVVTDPKKAAGALNWAVREMLARYNDFAEHNVRDINGFNNMKKEKAETDLMPQIVIIIDELADLMMAAPGEVEDSICRLAQMARAAGLHLIIATQRPSVDIITGVIKANIPSRLAFAVSSGIDSRTILDMVGAEKLLGKGDMLFYPVGMSKPQRIQGAFVTDKEVENIVAFVKRDKNVAYDKEMIDKITASTKNTEADTDSDEFFDKAIDLVVEKEKASVSMLQRQFRIGYNRAARLMDDLESRGIVGAEDGSKPRKVLMSYDELQEYKNGGTSE